MSDQTKVLRCTTKHQPGFTFGNTYPVLSTSSSLSLTHYLVRNNNGTPVYVHTLCKDFALVTPEGSLSAADKAKDTPEYTGGSSSYYTVEVTNTTTPGNPKYIAECNDIIEALGMNFAEGNAFKALWRRAAQRTLGKRKAGAKDDGLYDAEKVEFFGSRLVAQSKALQK